MGQAKLRGTYEERKKLGQKKRKEESIRLEQERKVRYNSLTDKQKSDRYRLNMLLAAISGISSGTK